MPESIGGGVVQEPRGVIHLGDMIDTGDKGVRVRRDEHSGVESAAELFGVQGNDGMLRYPIYEVHGNHDSPRLRNVAIEGMIDRNRRRQGVADISPNTALLMDCELGWSLFHRSGIVVGPNDDDLPISRYDSYQSLSFLKSTLAKQVGDSGRPIVILHHVDLLRYSRPCDVTESGGDRSVCCNGMATTAWCNRGCEGSKGISRDEWSHCDIAAYARAIEPYNVRQFFTVILHARRTDYWSKESFTRIYSVFGCKNSGAGGADRAIFMSIRWYSINRSRVSFHRRNKVGTFKPANLVGTRSLAKQN